MDTSLRQVDIAFAADDGFTMPLAVAIHSAVATLRAECVPRIFVVDGGISKANRARLDRVAARSGCELTWLDGSDVLPPDIRVSGAVTRATYYRAVLASLLPSDCEKAIYLDGDVLVRRDLSELFRTDVGDYMLLAVRDFTIPVVSMPSGPRGYLEQGLHPDTPYFNSGVLLMNIRSWRAEHIGSKVLDYAIRNRASMALNDQEALNVVLARRWGELDPRWNLQTRIFSFSQWPDSRYKAQLQAVFAETRANPFIVHFTGRAKPWRPRCGNPFQSEWQEALKESGWYPPTEYALRFGALQIRSWAFRLRRRLERRWSRR